MNIKIKLLPGGTVPTRGSREAAGYDIYAAEDVEIAPFSIVKIRTGICIEMPPGVFANVRGRSSLASKRNLICIHGLIDSDYRGEISVMLFNASSDNQKVYKGNRIAQIVYELHATVNFEIVNELNETERGDGGFGSTGV